jgi:hypothetical protein
MDCMLVRAQTSMESWGREVDGMRKYTKPVAKKITVGVILGAMP